MKKTRIWFFSGMLIATALAYRAGGQGAAVVPPAANVAIQPKDAAVRMVQAAQATIDGLNAQASITKLTPEFVGLRFQWRRKLLDAQLLLNPPAEERAKYLQAYVDSARQLAIEIDSRRNIDAGPTTIAEAQYAVAEAEYLQATLK